MKQFLIIALSAVTLNSCFFKKEYSKSLDGKSVKLYKDKDGKMNMTGTVTEESLTRKPFSEWYKKEYNTYRTQTIDKKELKRLLSSVTIEVYFGTWCEDSQREVPRFMRMLADLEVDKSKVKLVATIS